MVCTALLLAGSIGACVSACSSLLTAGSSCAICRLLLGFSPGCLSRPSATGNLIFSSFLTGYISCDLNLFGYISLICPAFSTSSQSAMIKSPTQPPPACCSYPRKNAWEQFVAKTVKSCYILVGYWFIFYLCSKWYHWASKILAKAMFIRCFDFCFPLHN